MSIEQALAENTSAIRELIAAIKAGVPTTAAQVAAVVTEAKATPCAGHDAETAKAETKATKTKKETAQATVANNGASSTPENTSASADAAAQEPAAEDPATSAAASVSYEDVKKAIIKLSQAKGRDAVVATLAKFGANAGPQLKPEQYAEFIAAAGA